MGTGLRILNRHHGHELSVTLFEECGDALFLFDPDSEQLLDANPMAQRLSGFTRSELLRMAIPYLFRSEVQGGLQRLRQAYRKTGVFHSQEGFLLRHQQDSLWVPVNLTVTRLHGESKTLGLVTARDVREQRQILAQLKASEERFRTLVEKSSEAIALIDAEGTVTYASPSTPRILGYLPAELVGRGVLESVHPDDLPRIRELFAQCLVVPGKEITAEFRYRHKDGSWRHIESIGINRLDDPSVAAIVGNYRDISARKAAEEEQRALEAQLRQAQKMEAVGQLAGGVAHDFNNLLTVIMGNIGMLQAILARPLVPKLEFGNERAAEDSSRELLAATEKAALRAAELTSKLLGFSRRTTLHLEPASINSSIDETVALLRRIIDPRITLVVNKASDLWLVQADLAQMNQVLMNLCLNARDALPEGGFLKLETENLVLDEDSVRWHLDARLGEFVRLRVSDTGQGIPPDILPRIFEPFFTTKVPGKGTGLGLAMVFGIIKQHHGWVDCTSKLNEGACFDIYLPRWLPAAGNQTQPPGTSASPRHGNETILLTDDEPMIRNLGRTILQSYGYQVLLAEDGLQAVEIYEREGHRIDLVILDLTMPQLSGRDALARLARIDPQVPVLFASGYPAENVTGLEQGRILGFIAKPYQPEDLARTVRMALDRLGKTGKMST